MKNETVDKFKIGDVVWCSQYGGGVVTYVYPSEVSRYSVSVKFAKGIENAGYEIEQRLAKVMKDQ